MRYYITRVVSHRRTEACHKDARIWTPVFMVMQDMVLTTEPSLQPRLCGCNGSVYIPPQIEIPHTPNSIRCLNSSFSWLTWLMNISRLMYLRLTSWFYLCSLKTCSILCCFWLILTVSPALQLLRSPESSSKFLPHSTFNPFRNTILPSRYIRVRVHHQSVQSLHGSGHYYCLIALLLQLLPVSLCFPSLCLFKVQHLQS